MKPLYVLAAALVAASSCAQAKSTSAKKLKQPEIGSVKWKRDFENALAQSKKSGKPIFAFFQEVPG